MRPTLTTYLLFLCQAHVTGVRSRAGIHAGKSVLPKSSQSVLLRQSLLVQRAGHGSQTHSQTVSEDNRQVPLHWRDTRELTHTPLPFRQEH